MLAAVGCSRPAGPPAPREGLPTDPSKTTAAQTPESAASRVRLEVLDEAGLADVLERNRGHAVLIDFWATWCSSCLELFPHTLELHEKYADRGLSVISVALNDPQDETEAVLAKLNQHGATFANYICVHGSGAKAFEMFAITDGALPHFKLYDRDGNLHQTFASGSANIEPQQIDRAVEDLLSR